VVGWVSRETVLEYMNVFLGLKMSSQLFSVPNVVGLTFVNSQVEELPLNFAPSKPVGLYCRAVPTGGSFSLVSNCSATIKEGKSE